MDEYLSNLDMEILFIQQNSTNINNFISTNNLIKQTPTQMLYLWQWLSGGRAICALIGWLIFAIQPTTNNTLNHLEKFIEN